MFEGDLVRLRAMRRFDLPQFTKWFQNYQLLRWLGRSAIPVTEEEENNWFDYAINAKDMFPFSIETLAGERLIGNCAISKVDWRNRNGEFGIALGEPTDWGKGYGTDAARLILGFAFDEMSLNRVSLNVYSFNPRGIRSYEKVGFKHEGVARQHIYREGEYHDMILMGILRDEWYANLQE